MSFLNEEQARELLSAAATAVPDALRCDDCFRLLAEYVEAQLSGKGIPEALKAVEIHFSQCPCCAYEYQALLEAVSESAEQAG